MISLEIACKNAETMMLQYGYVKGFLDIRETDTKWFFVADGYIYWKKKYYIAQVDIKSGKKKIIAEGVSDDKIIYTKGILRYVDADGNTKISECR